MSYEECFMCGKTNRNILAEIEFFDLTTKMPASSKNIEVVLLHLASCIRTKLIFSTDTTVCNRCFEELSEYDSLMVQLMENQKVLTSKLQKILSSHCKPEDEEAVQDKIVFDDTQLEDALNPELDTKEELVEGAHILNTETEQKEDDVEVVQGEDIIISDTKDDEFIIGDEIVLDSKEELIDGDEFIIAEYIDESDGGSSEIIMETNEDNETEEEGIEGDITVVQPNYEYLEGNMDKMFSLKPRVDRECQHCGEIFKSKVLLRNHVLQNHKVQVFACKICGIQRKDEEYLELHMNIHHGKTEFECRYCDKRFSRPVNTLRHMRKHWDKKGYQCEKCGERFSLDNMLYNHKKRHEAEENPLICSICNQSFKSMKTYNHHQLIHQENRPRHQCPVCPKSFTERYTLKMHMNVHPSVHDLEESKNYEENTCVICEANFPTKDLLVTHLKGNHDVVLK